MVALADIAGLPLSLNDEEDDIIYDIEAVTCNCSNQVDLQEIIPALLNKTLRYPERVYQQHSGLVKKEDESKWPAEFAYDIIYLPAGLLGIEYIKTHIFHLDTPSKAASIIQVLNGTLTVVMQKNTAKKDVFDIEAHVEDAIMANVSRGQKLLIPSGYYYTFVNTSGQSVVFARLVREEHRVDYKTLMRHNGLAYYLIAKNARQELVTNPRYRSIVDIKKISVDDLNQRLGYETDLKQPLYQEVCLKTKRVVDYF